MKDNVELIIFDCDGVLVDSEIIGIDLMLSLLEAQGVAMNFTEFTRDYSGLALDELIAKVRAEKGVAISPDLQQQFYPLLMTALAERLVSIEGTHELLANLPTAKCICSNSAMAQLDTMLRQVGLNAFFAPHIYSAAELGPGRSKPQPDIFLHAAEKMRATPAHTLVIEDSVHGVMAAKRAGMYVVGFTGGAHTTPDHQARLLAAGADAVTDAMSHLPEEIDRFRRHIA